MFGVPADIVRATFHGQFLVENPVIIRPTSDAYIARRTCPSLTIWADVERAKWEPDLLQHPSSRAIPWEGAGHWLHQERPAEFNAIVLNWIDGLPARDVELSASFDQLTGLDCYAAATGRSSRAVVLRTLLRNASSAGERLSRR